MNFCQRRITASRRSILLTCIFAFQIIGRICADENHMPRIGRKQSIIFVNHVKSQTRKSNGPPVILRNDVFEDLKESPRTPELRQQQLNNIIINQLRILGGIKHPHNDTEQLFNLDGPRLTNDTFPEEQVKVRLLTDEVVQTTNGGNSETKQQLNTQLEQTLRFQKRKKALKKSAINKDNVHKRKKRSLDLLFFEGFDDVYNCDEPPCPVWSEWNGQGLCDSTCGGGRRLLVRYCENARHNEPNGGCEGENTRLERCNTQPCPTWSAWTPTGKCSSTCGKGIRIFRRTCMEGISSTYGCVGENSEYRVCSSGIACPAQWTRWSKFGPCSKTCGAGIQIRKRICVKEGRQVLAGENTCSKGYSSQQRRCPDLVKCTPKYSQWSSWSHCDAVTCGAEGYRNRMRRCLGSNGNPIPHSRMNCKQDDLLQSERCRSEPCVKACKVVKTQFSDADNKWSQWSKWSRCSVSCGLGGKQSRSRMCFSVYIENSNNSMIIKEDNACEGKPLEIRTCHYNDGCPVWDSWQSWSDCTKSCGGRGRMKRERKCVVKLYKQFNAGENKETPQTKELDDQSRSSNRPNAESTNYPKTSLFTGGVNLHNRPRRLLRTVNIDSDFCQGGMNSSFESAFCNSHPCLPKWQHWQSWSECSATCGNGQRQRLRKCTEGNCHGPKVDIEFCFNKPCWTEWSSYSICTKACGGGVMKRSRKCIGISKELPHFRNCTGPERQNVPCNEEVCPIWGEWGSWSECSAKCGGGEMSRKRECIQGKCVGSTEETITCNYQPCPYWTNWSSFSCCSVSCGEGVKVRSRYCRHGFPGGPGCEGPETNTQTCNLNLCDKPTIPPLDPIQCGRKSHNTTTSLILKIFNGKVSRDHAWPWQVSWQHLTCTAGNFGCKWEHLCGAALLGTRWAVTAGHCIEEWKYRVDREDPGESWSIVVGMTKLYRSGIRHFLRQIFLHSQYDFRGVPKNDIALMKLRDTVTITSSEMPACLPENQVTQQDEECFITGWGNINSRSDSVASPVLREAKIPIVKFEQCRKIGNIYEKYLRDDQHMCAGDISSPNLSDSCRGDSGGPLVCRRPNGQWYLAGITSFGFYPCGSVGHAGIYVPVQKYEKWIKKTISTHSHNGC